ncbi:hypothetical protein E3N88_35636 [Mikania micrantha]|uniref:Cytochrome b-c1 complex subunit 8 n=1 Tax=Mikania micrantha TaxID=192012 RepID=A0A5N6M2E6_9ASTR|nr:hypothetical protein E3N88_35636 [Mikania micrantha]
MGKIPVKVRAVTYALSPFQQKVMTGLWKDFTHKVTHKVTENWISALLLVGPVVGVHTLHYSGYGFHFYLFSRHSVSICTLVEMFQSELLQRFSCFALPTPSEQLDSIHDDPNHVVYGKNVTIGSLELHNPSEQFVTIQQLDLVSDLIGDVVNEDTVRPHSADGNVPFASCRYWNRYGFLYVDGLPMLGQAESKPKFSFKANDRNIISVFSPSKLGSLMSGAAGSIQP